MGQYFYLQCKRLVGSVPGALCVIAVFVVCLCLVFSMTMSEEAGREENQQFPIAIAGQTDSFFFQMGLQALEAFDSSRFSLDVLSLSEEDARRALQRGEIAAYVVIPDGFMDAAMYGQILPIRFVSTAYGSSMVSVFKDEVTRMITDVLLESQKGVYGMVDALDEAGLGNKLGDHMNLLALRYVDYILMRDQVYSLQELGIADKLGLREYLLCGLSVLFLWLSCLPFAPKMLRPAPALGLLLKSRGRSHLGQMLCDFFAYALMLLPIAALPVVGGLMLPGLLQAGIVQLIAATVGVLLLCASLSFLLYQLCAQLLNGVLLQFFVTVAMCFVSGCMYPVYFFPEGVQRLAAWLPAGLARSTLAGCITGSFQPIIYAALVGYSCVFLGLSWLVRLSGTKEGAA